MKITRPPMIGLGLLTAALLASPTLAAPDSLDAKLRQAQPGQTLQIDEFVMELDKLPILETKITNVAGPQYLFSDRPETFRDGDGIAMQETVDAGVVRFYLYHCPTPEVGKKRISAVLENLGEKPMHVRFLRYAFPKPGPDYHRIGKEGLVQYWQSRPQRFTRTVQPGAAIPVDPKMERAIVSDRDLVHGFYEIEIDQPGRISVLQCSPDVSSVQAVKELPMLEPGHGPARGSFPVCNREAVVSQDKPWDTSQGPAQIIVADKKHDPWITGHDSISDEPQNLAGNYGVMYRMQVPYTSSDGQGVAMIVYNPVWRGQWCERLALAMNMITEDGRKQIVPLPANQLNIGGPPETAFVWKYPPAPKGETRTFEFIYSPPGASCLPVGIVLVPYTP